MGVVESLLTEDTNTAERAYRILGTHVSNFTRYDFLQRFFYDANFRIVSLNGLRLLDRIESIECESDPSYAPLCFELREIADKLKNKEGF